MINSYSGLKETHEGYQLALIKGNLLKRGIRNQGGEEWMDKFYEHWYGSIWFCSRSRSKRLWSSNLLLFYRIFTGFMLLIPTHNKNRILIRSS